MAKHQMNLIVPLSIFDITHEMSGGIRDFRLFQPHSIAIVEVNSSLFVALSFKRLGLVTVLQASLLKL